QPLIPRPPAPQAFLGVDAGAPRGPGTGWRPGRLGGPARRRQAGPRPGVGARAGVVAPVPCSGGVDPAAMPPAAPAAAGPPASAPSPGAWDAGPGPRASCGPRAGRLHSRAPARQPPGAPLPMPAEPAPPGPPQANGATPQPLPSEGATGPEYAHTPTAAPD